MRGIFMWNEDTPVEKHGEIYVKREDLYGQPPAPPLAKLRGARIYIKKLKDRGVTRIGVFDTRISKAGQGVSAVCQEYGLECWVGYPRLKADTEYPPQQQQAFFLGATIHPLKAGRTAILYAQFKKIVEANGGYMLPLGLTCRETVNRTAEVAQSCLLDLKNQGISIKTIVLSTGTATIATGIHLGTKHLGVKTIGVSCGMSPARQYKRMKEMAYPESLNHLFLAIAEPEFDYYEALDTSSCPFPTSPYYDMKAWVWLQKSLDKVSHPVLFWNIGV